MSIPADPEVFQPLTLEERERRDNLVGTIRLGEVTSLLSGKALREVRDRRLYRETHTSLEVWAREVCGIKDRARIYQLIEFANVQEAAAKQGFEVANERIARALGTTSPENYGLVLAVSQAETGKTNPRSAVVHAVSEVVGSMAAGMVEDPETHEPMPFSDLPFERKAEAVALAVQAAGKDRPTPQGTGTVKSDGHRPGPASGDETAMTGNRRGVFDVHVHVVVATCDQCNQKSSPVPTRDALFASTTFAGLGWSLEGSLAYCPACTRGRAMTQIENVPPPLSFTIAALESEAAPLDQLLQELNEVNDRKVALTGLIEIATAATHKLRVLSSLTQDVLKGEEGTEIVGGSVESKLRVELNHRSAWIQSSLEISREVAEPEEANPGTSEEPAEELPAETSSEAEAALSNPAGADALPEDTADSSAAPMDKTISEAVEVHPVPVTDEPQTNVLETGDSTLLIGDAAEPQADASQPAEPVLPDYSASSEETQEPAGDVLIDGAACAAETPVLSQPERVRAWVLAHTAGEFDARQVGEALSIHLTNVRKHLALLATGGLIVKVPGTGVAPNVLSRYRVCETTEPAPAAEGPPGTEPQTEPEQYRPSTRAQVHGWITRHPGEEFEATQIASELSVTIKSVIDVLHAMVKTGDLKRVPGTGSDNIPSRYQYVVWQGPAPHQKPVALAPAPALDVPEMEGEYLPSQDLPLSSEDVEVLTLLLDHDGRTYNQLLHKLSWARPRLDRTLQRMQASNLVGKRLADFICLVPKSQVMSS